jgi:pyruvate ferredoxin oxidoreductase beta subunit
MQQVKSKSKELFSPGHTACAGCGLAIGARLVIEAAGSETIIANATGCLEVTTSKYPQSSWGVPWIHSLFENAAAVASGIQSSLKQKGLNKKVKVIAQGGDGATYDIGFGLISGMWERNEDIMYVCYDNEAYMNTGVQASGATPYAAHTTTTPQGLESIGSTFRKKNMADIAIAHNLAYVATSSVGYPLDVQNKIKKALTFDGPTYVQILVPCVPGWGTDSKDTITLGKLAHQTGLWPIFEAVNGKVGKVMSFPKKRPAVEEYLKLQKRFAHLFKKTKGREEIKKIQKIADDNVKKYS